jgi:hypothetical protein
MPKFIVVVPSGCSSLSDDKKLSQFFKLTIPDGKKFLRTYLSRDCVQDGLLVSCLPLWLVTEVDLFIKPTYSLIIAMSNRAESELDSMMLFSWCGLSNSSYSTVAKVVEHPNSRDDFEMLLRRVNSGDYSRRRKAEI